VRGSDASASRPTSKAGHPHPTLSLRERALENRKPGHTSPLAGERNGRRARVPRGSGGVRGYRIPRGPSSSLSPDALGYRDRSFWSADAMRSRLGRTPGYLPVSAWHGIGQAGAGLVDDTRGLLLRMPGTPAVRAADRTATPSRPLRRPDRRRQRTIVAYSLYGSLCQYRMSATL